MNQYTIRLSDLREIKVEACDFTMAVILARETLNEYEYYDLDVLACIQEN